MNKIIFTHKFMDVMYDNMWTFMNLDMIKTIFKNIKITKVNDINLPDSYFTKKHTNSICFKGNIDEGHYVYINSNKISKGTYESNLLTRDDDDGVCHGAAIAFYMCYELNKSEFCLIENPKNVNEYKKNYKIILDVYLYLIKKGLWDNALYKNFQSEVKWLSKKENGIQTCVETQIAKHELETYIKRFI